MYSLQPSNTLQQSEDIMGFKILFASVLGMIAGIIVGSTPFEQVIVAIGLAAFILVAIKDSK